MSGHPFRSKWVSVVGAVGPQMAVLGESTIIQYTSSDIENALISKCDRAMGSNWNVTKLRLLMVIGS